MTTAKERAVELYNLHIALATTDGRSFRKTVMDTLMAETGCSLAAAATHYNNAKKAAPVEGLGRAPAPKGVQKPGNKKPKADDPEVADDDCFSVLELVQRDGNIQIGRCQSFVLQGDASEKFDDKVVAWPTCSWVMIKGLGPNSGDTYKLGTGEKEIKRYGDVGLKQGEVVECV
jgi:hypothetical protein